MLYSTPNEVKMAIKTNGKNVLSIIKEQILFKMIPVSKEKFLGEHFTVVYISI